MNIETMFGIIRSSLRDDQGNLYENTSQLPIYNRVVKEIQSLLMFIQAPDSMTLHTVTGDGSNYSFTLPTDWMAPVPKRVRMRSPATATSNYGYAEPMSHKDRLNATMIAPTSTGTPSSFWVEFTAGSGVHAIHFDAIPTSGVYIDILYYPKITRYTDVGQLSGQSTPWGGLCDEQIMRGMEMYLREGLEFVGDARKAWFQQSLADLVALFGFRKLAEQEVGIRAWEGLSRW